MSIRSQSSGPSREFVGSSHGWPLHAQPRTQFQASARSARRLSWLIDRSISHDFPRGHFHLRGDGEPFGAGHVRRTSSRELGRSEPGQHGKFKRIQFSRSLYHWPVQSVRRTNSQRLSDKQGIENDRGYGQDGRSDCDFAANGAVVGSAARLPGRPAFFERRSDQWRCRFRQRALRRRWHYVDRQSFNWHDTLTVRLW